MGSDLGAAQGLIEGGLTAARPRSACMAQPTSLDLGLVAFDALGKLGE